jgi:hypothetical protein
MRTRMQSCASMCMCIHVHAHASVQRLCGGALTDRDLIAELDGLAHALVSVKEELLRNGLEGCKGNFFLGVGFQLLSQLTQLQQCTRHKRNRTSGRNETHAQTPVAQAYQSVYGRNQTRTHALANAHSLPASTSTSTSPTTTHPPTHPTHTHRHHTHASSHTHEHTDAQPHAR